MYEVEECKPNLTETMKKICEQNIEDPDDFNVIFASKKQDAADKAKKAHAKPPELEYECSHYYILQIFVEKLKLIPEPQETDDEFEFLEEEVKKRILDEQERKKKIIGKVVSKIKFLDFPTMEIEQDEYKEPDMTKKKKVYKEWARNEDEDEDDEKNWMNELKGGKIILINLLTLVFGHSVPILKGYTAILYI